MRHWAAVALLCLSFAAKAQEPPFTFAASATSGNGQLLTKLTWDAQGATSCVGAGHPSWNGTKAASGSQDLPAITLSGTYAVALSCTWAGNTFAKLTWTNPTKNTDGTAFVNPKLVRVNWGASAGVLTNTVDVPLVAGALPTTYTVNSLALGTWFFGAKVVNTFDSASSLSNVVSKVITGSQALTRSIPLTVNPVPEAAVIGVE